MAADTGDGAIVRRNRPGTKAKDMYNWPDQDFNDMETVLAGLNNRNNSLASQQALHWLARLVIKNL